VPPPPAFLSEVRDEPTRRTLRRFALEGAATECTLWLTAGSVLTAWSLALGGDAGTVSSVQSLATAAQAIHLPAAIASSRFSRKRIATYALLLARLAWLPLTLLALVLPAGPLMRGALLATVAVSASLTMLAQNAHGAWMGDVIPSAVRGRFFGTRTWVAALGGSVAALLIAVLLDRGEPTALGAPDDGRVALPVMAALGVVVLLLGLTSFTLLRGAREPHELDGSSPARVSDGKELSRAFALLSDPALRRFLRYQILWGIAVAPGAAFFAMHVVTTMQGGYRLIAAHGIVLVIARVLTARIWGARVDRFGASRELAICSAGIGVMPLLWTFCDATTWWPMAIDAVLSGVLWGGQSIAVSAHPLGIGKPADRPFVLAWSALALGLAWALASLVAGAVARGVPADFLGVGPYRLLFVFSAIARSSCAFWALRLNDDGPVAESSATRSHA